MPDEEEDDLDAFLAAIDQALTEQLGPDHQAILSSAGTSFSHFDW